MQLTRIHHHSIVVADMERAVRFYKEVLGLQEIGIPSTFGGAGLRVRWFAIGDGQQIHLMPRPEPDTPSPRHIALQVADIAAARSELAEKGVAFEEAVEIPGAERIFIQDTEGNRIELIQWRETYHIVLIND